MKQGKGRQLEESDDFVDLERDTNNFTTLQPNLSSSIKKTSNELR
jgi:hypothetical protein